ncbi:MAG: CNP1-like family protein [Gammaproteobacteria bacterium]
MYQPSFVSAHRLPALCACLMLCSALPAFGGSLPREDGPVGFTPDKLPGDQPWKELAGELPAYPEQSRLLDLDIDTGANPFRYYLDPASLTAGDDRVVRFTSVIVSPSGVWNVTYEGLRCGDRSYRRIAYGSNGQWHALPETPWQRISGSGTQRYRKVLYEKYMCPPAEPYRNADQILRRLRSNRPLIGD